MNQPAQGGGQPAQGGGQPTQGARTSRRVVYAAITANIAIAVTKFAAAAATGSAAMLSEAIHSLVDTGNELLLLHGLRRSLRAPDAAVFEGSSFTVATRELLRRRGPQAFWLRLHRSKDLSVYSVFFEDLAALLGLLAAFLGIYLGERLHAPAFDAAGSIAVGAILCTVAIILIYETGGLLIGEGSSPEVVEGIIHITVSDPVVRAAGTPLTMQLGPNDLLVNLEVELVPDTSAEEYVNAVARIESAIRARYPAATRIFIEARRPQGAAARAR